MEKYFDVTNSGLAKEYEAYWEKTILLNSSVKDFLKDNNIETTGYGYDRNNFYIVPTEQDNVNFKGKLCKGLDNGLQRFKKNSTIAKAWIKLLDDKNLNNISKPTPQLYFAETCGRTRSSVFKYNNHIYLYFSNEYDELNPFDKDDFIEIKASEYHKYKELCEEEKSCKNK